MDTKRRKPYSFAKTENIYVIQFVIAVEKETDLFIEDSEGQTSRELTTQISAFGEVIGQQRLHLF